MGGEGRGWEGAERAGRGAEDVVGGRGGGARREARKEG